MSIDMVAALFACLAMSSSEAIADPISIEEAMDSIEQGSIESPSDAVRVMRGDEVLLERYEEAGRAQEGPNPWIDEFRQPGSACHGILIHECPHWFWN